MSTLKTKNKKATLKDVAKKAGVSVSAVSQILNSRKVNFCSVEKKALVKKAARDLNYQVNFGYRVMTGMKTRTVGIIFSLERIKNEEHIIRLTMSLSSKFENNGFSVYMATLNEEPKDNFNKMLDLVNRGCSSFILFGSPFGSKEIEDYFENHDISYIGYAAEELSRRISVDPTVAIEQFIHKFIKDGRYNFKLMLPIENLGHGRIPGLFKAFPEEDHDELIKKYCFPIPLANTNSSIKDFYADGFENTKKMMEQDHTVSGIIYLSDYFALGGVKYLLENNYKIGEDVALCGYNNTHAVNLLPYPISTVDHDIPNLCSELIKALDSSGPLKHLCKPKTIFK